MNASRRSPRRSKASNLRLKRRGRRRAARHVLDVQVRSSRENRIRLAAQTRTALKVGAVVFLTIGAVSAGRTFLQRAVDEGEGLRLEEVAFATDGTLTLADVLRETEVEYGVNLLELDLDAVGERLRDLPQVATVEVRRQLPSRLAITLEEREPIAWIDCERAGVVPMSSQGGFLVDSGGIVFRCRALLDAYTGLPTVRLREVGHLKDGSRPACGEFEASVRLLLELPRRLPRGDWDVREIDILSTYRADVRFQNDAVATFDVLDPDDLDRQLGDLVLLAERAREHDWHFRTLNLAMRRNIAATFYEVADRAAGAVPASASLERGTAEREQGAEAQRIHRQLRGILGDF